MFPNHQRCCWTLRWVLSNSLGRTASTCWIRVLHVNSPRLRTDTCTLLGGLGGLIWLIMLIFGCFSNCPPQKWSRLFMGKCFLFVCLFVCLFAFFSNVSSMIQCDSHKCFEGLQFRLAIRSYCKVLCIHFPASKWRHVAAIFHAWLFLSMMLMRFHESWVVCLFVYRLFLASNT